MRKNKGFLELRRLEAARDIADQLAQSGNKVMLDSDTLLLDGQFALMLSPLRLLTQLDSNERGQGFAHARKENIIILMFHRTTSLSFSDSRYCSRDLSVA